MSCGKWYNNHTRLPEHLPILPRQLNASGETQPNKQIPFLKAETGNEESCPARSTPSPLPPPPLSCESVRPVNIPHSQQRYHCCWRQEWSLYCHWPRPSICDESTLEGFVSLEHFRQTEGRQTEGWTQIGWALTGKHTHNTPIDHFCHQCFRFPITH